MRQMADMHDEALKSGQISGWRPDSDLSDALPTCGHANLEFDRACEWQQSGGQAEQGPHRQRGCGNSANFEGVPRNNVPDATPVDVAALATATLHASQRLKTNSAVWLFRCHYEKHTSKIDPRAPFNRQTGRFAKIEPQPSSGCSDNCYNEGMSYRQSLTRAEWVVLATGFVFVSAIIVGLLTLMLV
jgi:hypothetical protein